MISKSMILNLSKGFRKLPEKAQDVWWQFCEMSIAKESYQNLAYLNMTDLIDITNEYCKSPIEKIFFFTFSLVEFDYSEGRIQGLELNQQEEVKVNDKTYYLDFCFNANENGFEESDYKLAIECDGHDFHEKTKEQVTKDNERTLDLKMAGYDILRFSGSQIYNEPFKCAISTLKYILKKVNE